MDRSALTLAWIAGWFEARGHIECSAAMTVLRGRPVRRDRFGVVVCGPQPLVETLNGLFGGHWCSRRVARRVALDIRWRATGAEAARFLALIAPHVVTRRAELATAALFYKTISGRRGSGSSAVPREVVRQREELSAAMDALRPRRKGYAEARSRARQSRAAPPS